MEKTNDPVFFYEHEFYPFSNFSSFQIEWKGKLWPTSEHVYQAEKFEEGEVKEKMRGMRSAHEVFKYAEAHKDERRNDWGGVKVSLMKEILKAKVAQHPYVLKKLRDSGDRMLIENSWRDPEWGWGPEKNGKNLLGKLWMEVREEVRLPL